MAQVAQTLFVQRVLLISPVGLLELEILSCSRLLEVPEAKRAFCTAAITNKPWKPLNRLVSPANGPMHNLNVERAHGVEHGISFQRYQDPEMELNCILVSSIYIHTLLDQMYFNKLNLCHLCHTWLMTQGHNVTPFI